MKYLLFTALLAISACSNMKKTEDTSKTEITDTEEVTYKTADKDIKILSIVYLSNVDGSDQDNRTAVMSAPDENSTKLFEYYLGDQLSVVEYVGEWLGILDSTYYNNDNTKLDSPIYRVGYIKKNTTGSLEKFRLKEEELAMIGGNSYYDYTEPITYVSSDTLQFEFVSKEFFKKEQKKAKNFLLQDTLVIRKENGILKLPCEKKTVTKRDIEGDGDNMATYTYVGQVEELNAYVIGGSFWESGGYVFYDKTTGEQIGAFENDFLISPDKKYIADICGNPYDNSTDFMIHKIDENGKIAPLISYSFTKWTTLNSNHIEKGDYFFDSNNLLYVRINHMKLQGWAGESKEHLAQYIRIRIMI